MRNVIEDEVRALYAELRVRNPEFCPCEQCRDDAIALALNQIRPRYVTGREPLVRAQLQRDELRAELTVAVLDAMRRVRQNPRHPADTPPSAP